MARPKRHTHKNSSATNKRNHKTTSNLSVRSHHILNKQFFSVARKIRRSVQSARKPQFDTAHDEKVVV
jgi:hypothetical protein